jgi:hypothetical protein
MFSVIAPRCSQLLGGVGGYSTTRSYVACRVLPAACSSSSMQTNYHHEPPVPSNQSKQQQQRCMSSTSKSSTTSVSGVTDHIVSAVQSLNGVHFMSIDQLR